MAGFFRDVCVIGGAGHVGLPLALTFADTGLRTLIYDVSAPTVERIQRGEMPFIEHGGEETLARVLKSGRLEFSTTPDGMSTCRFLILVIGTPVDEHLNPSFNAIQRAIDACAHELRDGQILILRSTVFPGISQHIQRQMQRLGKDVKVAFCPERVAEGYSLKEFRELPQIISAFEPETLTAVKELFGRFTPEFVEMEPMEAELCKLMTNAWRYIQFATVNQFYMIAEQHRLDFDRILHGCRHNYPRMAGMPRQGFAAGPCLVKDTMQLAAFSQNTFALGHAAMLINEGLPNFLVEQAKHRMELTNLTVGILGMAFKAESDDPRQSLSYKLRKLLRLEAREVLCHDPYVKDPLLVPIDRILNECQAIFVGTPHKMYRTLTVPKSVQVIDVWNVLPK